MSEAQKNLELQYADRNANHIFMDYKEHLTIKPMNYIKQFLITPIDNGKRPDLINVRGAIFEKFDSLEDIIFSMITFILIKKDITLQAVVGTVFNAFKCSTFRRRTVLIELLLHAILECEFIKVDRKGDFMYFQSKLPLNSEITKRIDTQGFVLPLLTIPKVTSNKSIGYTTFQEHVISGGKIKEHDYEVCLDHLNRLNSIAYTCEKRLDILTVAKFNRERKLKDNGEYENDKDIEAREASFQQIHGELPSKVEVMVVHGNRFHLAHKYCNRVRTYVRAEHFNYMGTKFLKSMIHFADKELSTGEW